MTLIPIGISDFEEIRTDNYYFVDKSMLCADIVRNGAKVILLPRPRRFGKTLAMSMLNCFFSDRSKGTELFDGLAVAEHEDVMVHCGVYPTVYLTFEGLEHSSYPKMLRSMGRLMSALYLKHQSALNAANPEGFEKKTVQAVIEGTADEMDLEESLRLLTRLIHRATGKRVVVLVDEYDKPIHAGFGHGYYDEIIEFMCNFLSGAFKDNSNLEKGVLTGIMRIAKESIFSGLNNLDVFTLLDQAYSSHFGFTQSEVIEILETTGQINRAGEIKAWYNGYRIGDHTMYNPWSIMKCASRPGEHLQSHWVNTSDNQLVRDLVTGTQVTQYKENLQTLLRGETIREKLDTNIILSSLAMRSFWGLLTFSGYLTPRKVEIIDGKHHCDLALPNREVGSFFEEMIMDWISEQTRAPKLKPMLTALLEGRFDFFAHQFAEAAQHTLSYHDTGGGEPERVYQVFMLGMLIDLKQTHHVRSNRESGYGRYDIMVIPKQSGNPGFVLEFKQCDDDDPQAMAKEALDQIRERDYAAELRAAGATPLHAIGIACSGKRVALEIGEIRG